MDMDLTTPVVAPESASARAAGATPLDAPVTVHAPITVDAPPVAQPSIETPRPVDADAATLPALLPRARAEVLLADNQVYAAASLVRLGHATRVVLVNAAVDAALPDDWEIRGTPVHLDRREDGRVRVIVGRR